MEKKRKKKEDETKQVITNCDKSKKVVVSMNQIDDGQQFAVAICDRKDISIESLIHTIRG